MTTFDAIEPFSYAYMVSWQVVANGQWFHQLCHTELDARMYLSGLLDDEDRWNKAHGSVAYFRYQVTQYENPTRVTFKYFREEVSNGN